MEWMRFVGFDTHGTGGEGKGGHLIIEPYFIIIFCMRSSSASSTFAAEGVTDLGDYLVIIRSLFV